MEINALPVVTRVEVIDRDSTRAFTAHYEPGVTVHLQDEGRTLKVFAEDVRAARAGTHEALQIAVAAAFEGMEEVLDNPEYGGTHIDFITDRLYRAGVRAGRVEGARS